MTIVDKGTFTALPAGEGEANHAFGFQRTIKVSSAQSGGRLTVFEESVPPGGGPPLHVHHGQVEVFYLIDGRVKFRCGGEIVELGTGATVLVPADTPHTFRNVGDGPARVLVSVSPGGLDEFMRRVEAEGLKPPADLPRIGEIGRDFGLEFVGPPLD